jgi:hypothetical protein
LLTAVRFPEPPALFSTVGPKRNYELICFHVTSPDVR